VKLPLRFLPAASAEIRKTRIWYDQRVPGLGKQFLDRLNLCLGEIGERPLSFQVVLRSVRRAVFHRFPYCVYFVVRERDIVVVAVMHGARKPSAWQRCQVP
jgi:plasmid stabilization system protein ParE